MAKLVAVMTHAASALPAVLRVAIQLNNLLYGSPPVWLLQIGALGILYAVAVSTPALQRAVFIFVWICVVLAILVMVFGLVAFYTTIGAMATPL